MKTKLLAASVISFLLLSPRAFAAVGCDVNDPDRDVARLFPGSTGYKTRYLSIKDRGGEALLAKVEARLGDKFHGLYETIDVPYTLYEVLKGSQCVGYIHGVNEKGVYGGLQVFLALNPQRVIKAFYFQKLTSRQAKALRSPAFAKQFEGLSLADFLSYDPVLGKAEGKVAAIRKPAPGAEADFRSALRGVKKNLVLMDEFLEGKP